MRPVARLLDSLICTTGACSGGQIVTSGSYTTLVNNLPIATMWDLTSNCSMGGLGCWSPRTIITGSFTTLINNRPVARLFDKDTGGLIITGSINTLIG
jgi:uncharacterized Zn-binding protein involved in type VI secretion